MKIIRWLSTMLLLLASPGLTLAQGRTAQFALTGDAAPDGNGVISEFGVPLLNNSGDTGFLAGLAGTVGGTADDLGLFRGTSTALLQVAREGAAAPDGNGLFALFFTYNNLNDSGQMAFSSSLTGTAGGSADNSGIFSGSGGVLTQVAREGEAISNGTFRTFGIPAINASGRVAFEAFLDGTLGGTADDNAIFRDDAGGSLTQIAREGQSAPDGNGLLAGFGNPLINVGGNVAFDTSLTGTAGGIADDSGIFVGSGGALIQVAREGQASPDGNGLLSSVGGLSGMNDAGQVVFENTLSGTSGGSLDDNIILRGDAGGLTRIAREGQAVPGENGEFSSFDPPYINAQGTVAFPAVLRNTAGGSLDDSGIYRGTGSTLVEIAREGQAAPDGNGKLSDFERPAINAAGATAFRVLFRDTAGGVLDDRAILLSDGIDTVQVVREGDSLAGSTVTGVAFDTFEAGDGGGDGLNDFGQVAYLAALADGNQGIFVFTPDLHWRSSVSSSWDSASFNNPGGLSNWTLSLRPAAIHDTFIDPDNDVFVTGPAGAETVKSLAIGGGLGIATLNLNGGSITALEGVQITGNGVLTGTGAIVGTVNNSGEVIADNITMTSLVNNGIVSGTTAANNRINARLVNQTGGEVISSNGQSIRFTAANNTNSGTIESIGGEVRFDQILVNEVGGDIFASDATLRFNGGLANIGRIGLTIGSSFIFGGINNIGSVIQSGAGTATFFDNFTNNGTVQVSAGSTAVFFGDVSGPGAFTGTGTVFFEGAVSPGASPGQVSVEGDLNLGIGAHTLMEIGGLVRGDDYDAFDIGGNLNILGGELEVSLFDTGGGLFAPKLGDSFDLFSAESISGGFDVLTLAVLGEGLGWQLDFLTDAIGTTDIARLSVVASAVPVPAAVWLFGSGLLGLVTVASKRRSNREQQTV